MLKVKAGLKQFMGQLIDYAGMFPPAKLDFKTAFSNYLAYQNHQDQWMIERFVFPIAKYEELPHFQAQLESHKPTVKLSTLPEYHASAEMFLSSYMTQFVKLSKTISSLPGTFDFRYFEFKLPLDLMEADQKVIDEFLTQLVQFAKDHPLTNPKFFIEMHIDADWKFKMNRLTNVIAHHPLSRNLGFKLRCGGVTSDAFPEADVVATAIHLCKEKNIPMKFTAGLHHPIRHFNDSVQTKMYGFFNIFSASILAKNYTLSIEEIKEILIDEKPSNFNFADQGMKWRDLTVKTNDIAQARENLCISFGSCSFDEPREDLHSLHLI